MANRRGPVAVQMAAAAGKVDAQYELGELYRQGPHDKPNYKESTKWHWAAAMQGNIDSKLILIEMMRHCFMADKYAMDVRKWGRELAEAGNVRAQFALAFATKEDPMSTYYSEHYLHWMGKAADQGYRQAIFLLGIYYEFVDGPEKSAEKAFELYKKAADMGYAPAMESLGVLYAEGRGTTQSDEAAIQWLQQAITGGRIREASLALGKVYERRATRQDYQEAVSCYRRAHEAYSDLTSYHLGRMYEYGRGVPKDYSEAARWYLAGCERSFDIARDNKSAFYQLRHSIFMKLGLDHPEGCQLAAEGGNAAAQAEFGLYSIWNPPDDKGEKASRLFRLSAEQGDATGQFCWGCMIEFNSGKECDPEAAPWFNKAAQQGLKEGQAAMGRACCEQSDYHDAANWFRLATEQGDLGAIIALGQLYFDGKGVEKDPAKAIEMFRSVAEYAYHGSIDLMRNIQARGPSHFMYDENIWQVRE